MFDISALSAPVTAPVTAPLNAEADKVLHQVASAASEDGKIDKSAKDFESILLGTWLKEAEASFGSLPGGDDEGDADVGKEQFDGIAMQSLGGSMTASGGIGIAKMISAQLHKTEDARFAKAEPAAKK